MIFFPTAFKAIWTVFSIIDSGKIATDFRLDRLALWKGKRGDKFFHLWPLYYLLLHTLPLVRKLELAKLCTCCLQPESELHALTCCIAVRHEPSWERMAQLPGCVLELTAEFTSILE